MDITKLLFLGISPCFPDPGGDSASYCLGEELLIDTGWYANRQLREAGIFPPAIRYICISHAHHDHILGLPALLYEHYAAGSAGDLYIFGPEESVGPAVDAALRFIQKDYYWPRAGYPLVQGLAGEDSFETPNFEVQTISADHAVPGRCFKIRDKRNDILMGFGGDGAYQAGLADFFAGCDVLVHEFSFGLNTPSPNVQRHSSIQDAARCAEEAGVRMLCPVHGPKNLSEQIEACGRKAAGIYHGVLHWPRAGELLCLSK